MSLKSFLEQTRQKLSGSRSLNVNIYLFLLLLENKLNIFEFGWLIQRK